MPADLRLRFNQGGVWVQPGRAALPPPPVGGTTQTLLSGTFANLTPAAPISLADFRTAMGDNTISSTGNLVRTQCVVDGTKGKVIRQTFAASSGDGITAFVGGPFAGKQLTNAKIRYFVRYNGGLGWGCKGPGLGGVNSQASPSDVTGGKTPINTNGFSGRHMFLHPNSGETSTNPDYSVYMYHNGQADIYGDNEKFGTGPVVGQWHEIETEYRLNTVVGGVGQPDGTLISKWDGATVINRTNYNYRAKADIFITHLYWHIFWGGANKAAWAPTVASSVDIADLVITTEVPA